MDVGGKHVYEDNWLAKALVYYQIIDQSLYEELVFRNSDEKFFAKILTDNDYLNDKEIRQFVKLALQIPTINLDKIDAEKDVLEAIPEELCLRYNLLALQMDKTHIAVAFSNPFNLDAENEIEYLTRKYVKKFYAPHEIIKQKINEYYAPEKIITSFVNTGKDVDIKFSGDSNLDKNSPVVKLVNQIIWDSISKKASDIHIEPKENSIQVRFRVDGVLRNELEVPRSIHSALASRIKIISNLNIAETRKPQDGKAKVMIEETDIDLRVSILPTSFGEKIVIRILDKRNATVSLDKMGIVGYNREQLEKCFQLKQGMVLVTGPTGSGKSTTLYAAINRIRSTTNNILTIEDPIEYMFDGINQVQVNERAGVTFASALRSFLRQDPDVILVGEIRDKETAEISIQASLTGHLVLSTLHTNDTFTTITRLKDMGVDKFKITEALEAVIAQRLVRKLCSHCKVPVDKKNIDEKLYKILNKLSDDPQVFEPKGCAKCGFAGYSGRIGVYEILMLDTMLKDMVANDASLQLMRKTAKINGFRNLFEDAMRLVGDGITDYDEIVRVINPVMQRKEEAQPPEQASPKTIQPQNGDSLKIELSGNSEKAEVKVEGSGPATETVDTSSKPARILITDDSDQTRLMVTKIIQKMSKWETLEARDGEEALKIIHQDKPDLLVLDIMMPNMDGYEVLQEIKSNPELENIPVLIFSALKTQKSEQKVYELGADGFIVKPIDPKRMIEQISKVLERKKIINKNTLSPSPSEELDLKLV
ncbi:MAG: type II/IV secretion system protein [Calditrichaeota bacterium]|nr:MAG: type II/IV secretion system protein [Calditrichota bacterium]MBL1204370.1 type II/IV secretion system protein [Calditrichota bacterium]NOG44199.1 Flp pilus assembly complex ATPase component TadA [Calditrichota bacterium]